jgi:hypothetical protein
VNELRRQSLLDSLGLSQTQLQQLAGLLGNDHIKHIAKDKVAALKAAHPSEHVVALLAKQVLELQPQLASLSPAAAAAAAATAAAKEAAAARERERALIDPVVRQVVEAAVANVCSKAAEAAAAAAASKGKKGKAAAGAAAEAIAPEVKQLVATAVSRAVAAAAGDAAGSDDEDEHHDELEDGHHEDEEQGHEEDAAAAAAGDADAAGAAANGSSTAGNSTDMLVDRCRRALLQYGPCDVSPPVQVGSGDRWLLQHKGILMRGVGLEDMSKTPSHVLLQPLRLSVYASMGLSSVTEYLCVPDEKWKEWAAGRAVSVPAQPAAGGKKSSKPRRGKDKGGAIDPAVKKLVAAMFANVVAANGGAPAAAADAAPAAAGSAAAAAATEEPVAAAGGATSAEESPVEEPAAAAADAEAEAEAADVDGIHPAVKKLVAAAVANVVAGKVSGGRGSSKAFDPLPKTLPSKPLELVQFIVRRLRALDPSAEQFSRHQEKLLLLQVVIVLQCFALGDCVERAEALAALQCRIGWLCCCYTTGHAQSVQLCMHAAF